ncbi:aminotransferase class IV [Micromonospora sp. NPDC048830]|uniref:aminotransferase class IV n=1 Tax=Micromonospora sp. NPDC048830 TaxID=3364257 RepID=UPI0037199634
MAAPYINVNGKLVGRAEAAISVLDHGLLYGDGCFETVQVTAGRVFKLYEHLQRLERSLRALHIDVDWPADRWARAIAETVTANALESSFVKVVVTRGQGVTPLMDPRGLTPNIIIFAEPLVSLVGADAEAAGVRLKTSAIRRLPPGSVDAKVKSLNYLNSILAKIEAIESGCDDALLLDDQGEVAEATAYNVFVVDGGSLRTPWTASALQGVTQHAVGLIAQEKNIPLRRDRLTLTDIYAADEVFLSSTAGGVIPVGSVDGRVPLSGAFGPVTWEIKAGYTEMLTHPDHSTALADLS